MRFIMSEDGRIGASEPIPEMDTKVSMIRYHYDRYERLWYVAALNSQGDIIESDYTPKDLLNDRIADYQEKYNVHDIQKYDR